MGWISGWHNKSSVVKQLTDDYREHLVTSKVVGNHFWMVVKSNNKNVILLHLLRKEGNRWGYKSMDESMHPYYYTCPSDFLYMAPVTCQKWRDNVLKFSRPLMVGEIVTLQGNPLTLEIISVCPLRGKTADGKVYRIPRSML